jgi:SAM-dependent methyltransferase
MNINDYDIIADLYDIYVPSTYDISFFINETAKASGEVLELMSGTGRVSIPLIEAGVRLTCVDISVKLNAILENKLRQKGLKADVYRMDARELDLQKKFDMVIIPFQSFSHIVSTQDQRKTLERIKEHLKPGGMFICTLGNTSVRKKSVDGQLKFFRKYPLPEIRGELLLWIVETFSPDDAQVVEGKQFYEIYNDQGVLQSKRLLELQFRLTNRDEFEEAAKASGFRIKAFYRDYSYAEFKDDSPFMIWILEN